MIIKIIAQPDIMKQGRETACPRGYREAAKMYITKAACRLKKEKRGPVSTYRYRQIFWSPADLQLGFAPAAARQQGRAHRAQRVGQKHPAADHCRAAGAGQRDGQPGPGGKGRLPAAGAGRGGPGDAAGRAGKTLWPPAGAAEKDRLAGAGDRPGVPSGQGAAGAAAFALRRAAPAI